MILEVASARAFDFKFGSNDIGRSAAVERFWIERPIRIEVIVGALEAFKPALMRPIGPVAMSEAR